MSLASLEHAVWLRNAQSNSRKTWPSQWLGFCYLQKQVRSEGDLCGKKNLGPPFCCQAAKLPNAAPSHICVKEAAGSGQDLAEEFSPHPSSNPHLFHLLSSHPAEPKKGPGEGQ